MSWHDRTVLVTGAGGFIGSHLVERLAREGARVRAFVRYNSRGDHGLLGLVETRPKDRIEVVTGNLDDASAVLAAMDGIDTVFHLGALISIPYSYLHPREVVTTNVLGTLNVLEAARLARPRRVVHTSSSEVYGTARSVPISEAHVLQGQSPYSASKIGADKLAESYCLSFDVPVVTVRPFNTYGPRQSARAVIPTIITQALEGDAVHLGATDPTRDFTYVDDTVAGLLLAATAGDAALGREINLGVGQEISIGDLAARIVALVGRKVEIVTAQERLRPRRSEVNRLLSDNARARDLLGWRPAVALDDGLSRTIAWIRDNIGRFSVGRYEV